MQKDGIGGFRLRQREFARDGAGTRERIHRVVDGFGDPRIAVAPQERVADTDANSGDVACACSRDEPDRIDAGRIERHEAVSRIRYAARQQARRVESWG